MLSSESESDVSLEQNPAASEASADLPPAMARILDSRVRANAKNNPKNAPKVTVPAAKPAAPKSALPKPPAVKISEDAPIKASVALSAKASSAPDKSAETLREMHDVLLEIQENSQNRDRAFDLLYEELNGYKNDFYLERLKPTLRALLFLLDSIEEFEREVEETDKRGDIATSEIIKANLVHFREQLVEVFTISDLAPIEADGDVFDPKTQRAVEVVAVEANKNNTVQRQVRGGWKLGGKMLRPADVVVGRTS